MIIEKNIHLAPKTTMKIGGYADTLYIPENEEELITVAQEIYDKNKQVYILSGGSNLLINDRHFEQIIYMNRACLEMNHLGNGRFYIGASNRIQKVISFVNEAGYGGFEELVGLPAFFGGVIYMNAGIGGRTNSLFTIGDFVESVRAWDLTEKKMVEFSKEQCEFTHRKSVFHNRPYVILGAVIQCIERSLEESKQRKAARLQFCKENFEYGKGCFGSCFSKASPRILKAVSLLCKVVKLGRGKVTFAENEVNWLVNRGEGRYQDAIRIIQFCQRVHQLVRREIQCEVILWE